MVTTEIRPFALDVPQAALDDLADRLARTRWPDASPLPGWGQGTELSYLQELAVYWRRGFDWRKVERRWDSWPHFRTTIDGFDLHFIHARGRGPRPLPLLLTHGWPSSFLEFEKILPLLTDPAAHGGSAADAFDVVIPSLPGFGLSSRPAVTGVTKARIAGWWAQLMTERLGYAAFCAHGGDIGAGVTSQLGLTHGSAMHGIHIMAVVPPWLGAGSAPLTPEERAYQALVADWERDEDGYGHIQGTRPQTLAYGLNDSPVGLAAWIVEKFRSWSDCQGNVENRFPRDELLANISLYWLTETLASSIRLYYDGEHYQPPTAAETRIEVPTAVALTTEPVDRAPRAWADRTYANIQHWTEFPRGGHFMAAEEPQLLAGDLRNFFRRFR